MKRVARARNYNTTPKALLAVDSVPLFTRHKVMTKPEVEARKEVLREGPASLRGSAVSGVFWGASAVFGRFSTGFFVTKLQAWGNTVFFPKFDFFCSFIDSGQKGLRS